MSLLGSLAFLGCLLSAGWARAVTLAELRADPKLTPERLIAYFADFKFEANRQVRQPEAFLASRSGDCDDFATLAADLLREKGYSPRLVAVYMPNEVHVVCYVAETQSYLDYNRRRQPSPLVRCDGDLGVIAARVAESFRTSWRSVSEFTFTKGVRRFVTTVFH
ncbi:MAG TPA: transglutaminase domain-containing protein [Candidatus Paceibacterota bacterium]|nr:transglutaminase domain-containing protein [Verrucomicrobiota bacterium]HSA09065.1 transglutaminase domain-containing protein [Candidatus Paceibacterota bacterium]